MEIDDQVDFLEIIEPPSEHRVIVFSQGRCVRGEARASSDLEEVGFYDRGQIQDLDLSDAVRPVLEKLGWV